MSCEKASLYDVWWHPHSLKLPLLVSSVHVLPGLESTQWTPKALEVPVIAYYAETPNKDRPTDVPTDVPISFVFPFSLFQQIQVAYRVEIVTAY